MNPVTPAQLAAVRGGLLGLLMGDAVGAVGGQLPAQGALPATSAGQLACFTVEGVIRASVRYNHKGICHPPSVVWHAYTRWAAGQGVTGIEPWPAEVWPDGWLADVPALRIRRGSAPATVAALRGRARGTLDKPVGTSLGAHALIRSLPVGLAVGWLGRPVAFAREIAALTHAVPAADVAGVGASLLAKLAGGHQFNEAVQRTLEDCATHVSRSATSILEEALTAAESDPRQIDVLRRLASDRQASSALAGGVYVAASFAEPDRIREAVLFAADVGEHVAAAAGAFLAAAAGVFALPVDLVSRLELAWVADVLAQDLISEIVDSPSGSDYEPAADPTWWNRYPGW